jgi:GxxExxY protein
MKQRKEKIKPLKTLNSQKADRLQNSQPLKTLNSQNVNILMREKPVENIKYIEGKYPHSGITDRIIKSAIEVHKNLGPGFLENIYENALILELKQQGLKVEDQKLIPIAYKGIFVGEHRVDLLIENEVIVENKTVKEFDDIHQAQLLSYLKATGKRVGLLLNFARTKIDVKRIVL